MLLRKTSRSFQKRSTSSSSLGKLCLLSTGWNMVLPPVQCVIPSVARNLSCGRSTHFFRSGRCHRPVRLHSPDGLHFGGRWRGRPFASLRGAVAIDRVGRGPCPPPRG